MNKYWIEVMPDGRIYSSAAVPDSVTPSPLQGGEMLEVETLCVPNEIAYYDDTLVPIGQPPNNHHRFDYVARAWVDSRNLDGYKIDQWETIKSQRDAVEFGSFTYNGMVFDGNNNAQRRLNSYISVSKSALASGTEFQANFILANNEIVTLTAQDFVALELAKVSQVALAFDTASQLRLQIEAAQTIEDVLNVSWPVEIL